MAKETRNKRRRRSRRRIAKLTREGKAFVFVTVGVALAALNTGNNLIYLMLGLMLSLILLSMIMSELVMDRLEVTRLLPTRAFANEPAYVRFRLRNDRKHTASYSLEIEDTIDGEDFGKGALFLKVAPGDEETSLHRRTPSRRGVLKLRGYRVRTRYPFGIVEKSKLYSMPGEWLVYPSLKPQSQNWDGLSQNGEERTTDRKGVGSEEFGELREYVPGDDARAIHWRRTASLGQLVVRERTKQAAAEVSVFVNNVRPDFGDLDSPKVREEKRVWEESFETSISRAAHLVKEAVERGARARVVTRSGDSPYAEPGRPPDAVWRFLALLEPVGIDEAKDEPEMARHTILIDAGKAA